MNKTIQRIILKDSRSMNDVASKSVHLIITSPPYWQIKDYGTKNQIGYGENYDNYVDNLNKVWRECNRVLADGCRLCINIGDQFLRAIHYGRYRVVPIREDIINYCTKKLKMDYLGAIIWQKRTTTNTTGGASVMGTFPYPRGGIISIDYEFILLFKKLGTGPKVSKDIKEKSKLTTKEWSQYFQGHWNFNGEKQINHIAMFPLELPLRLIKMFSFVGDIILDPFLGSGTTMKAAIKLNRNSVGYEINKDFLPIIKEKIGYNNKELFLKTDFKIIKD